MNIRTALLAAALALLALFAAVNWPAFSMPTDLSLGFMVVQAPLGLVMLAVSALISALFLFYILFQQAGVIVETRRTARELKSHRELADKAEASRFTELRAFLEGELRRAEAQQAAGTRELAARIDALQSGLHADLAEAGRVMAAHVGQVDDKLDQRLPAPRA